jgi:PAS domain S-box-containing protein
LDTDIHDVLVFTLSFLAAHHPAGLFQARLEEALMFSLAELFTLGTVYLTILFGSAYATERGLIPKHIAQHPAIRVLSLGVFAGAFGYFGSLGLAANYGASYLIYFIGSSCAFLIAPALLTPLTRLSLTHKLGSLADVFAFRYPSSWVGGVISMFMLFGVLPLLALQIQAVSQTVHLLNQELSEDILAIVFCAMMVVFAILFGARHLSTRDKHDGLVVAIGMESIIKLLATLIVAYYSLFHVFDGPGELANWVSENPQLVNSAGLDGSASRVMLLLFFGATIAMPHMYHMLITENDDERVLHLARWGFPIYMLLLSLCIPPILWAATNLQVGGAPEMYAISIGVSQENQGITMVALVAGLAAASGVLIVTTLALSSMLLNHVLLPFYRPSRNVGLMKLILNSRRALICTIILAAFGIYQLLGEEQNLSSLGIVSFVAVLQFLPGLLGAFHWRGANKTGLLAGLTVGYVVWSATMLIPLLKDLVLGGLSNIGLEQASWHTAATFSLLLNTLFFILGSKLSKTSTQEMAAADESMSDSIVQTFQGELQAQSVSEIESNLASALGRNASNQTVALALSDLRYEPDENRPHALSQLRSQMETNLASLLGQTIAHRIIENVLPFKSSGEVNVHTIENRLKEYRVQLTGLAAEMDGLRRYHRQILQDLPTAVCSVDHDQILRIWNLAMETLTGLSSDRILGSPLSNLPEPWKEVLFTFVYDSDTHRSNHEMHLADRKLLLNLHKAAIDTLPESHRDLVIVIEDLTDSQILEEQMLHSERLATIGQFAAGVAHEIGNPVTGIACLAQDLVEDFPDDAKHAELSRQILEQTERISAILQTLMSFAHGGKEVLSSVPVDIHQCVDEAISLLSLSRRNDNITLLNNCAKGVFTLGSPQRLSQVFINILTNAQDASGGDGSITVSSSVDEENITVRITDQGKGIPDDHLKRVFDPFFTTKDPGEGTGLGLAIVSSIMKEHSGTISAEASTGGGTTLVVQLPSYRHQS